MAITEEDRNHLYNSVRDKLSARDAATMMELLPPVGWADVATKRDLDHLREVVTADIDRLRVEVDARIDGVRAVMATKEDLRALAREFKGDLKWWMTVQGGVAVLMVTILGILVKTG
jgi:hypothetical protein